MPEAAEASAKHRGSAECADANAVRGTEYGRCALYAIAIGKRKRETGGARIYMRKTTCPSRRMLYSHGACDDVLREPL